MSPKSMNLCAVICSDLERSRWISSTTRAKPSCFRKRRPADAGPFRAGDVPESTVLQFRAMDETAGACPILCGMLERASGSGISPLRAKSCAVATVDLFGELEPPNDLVLIGYRGTGKEHGRAKFWLQSSAARWSPTDAEIVKARKLSVPEIVKRFGWDHFRDLGRPCVSGFLPHGTVDHHYRGRCHSSGPENVEALRPNRRVGVALQRPSKRNHAPDRWRYAAARR